MIIAEGLDLPDGATVTVAANDGDIEYDLSPAELSELDAALAEADADDGEPVAHDRVLAALDRLHPAR